MSGAIVGAVVVAGAAMYASDQANSAADQRADDANKANQAASNRSRELSAINSKKRRTELLRRFDIKSQKTQDTALQLDSKLAIDLTNFEMQLASAQSTTDNALASRKIIGRLSERYKAAQEIQASMKKGTMIQEGEQDRRGIGDNLEMMRMNYESENLNLDIDVANSINSANNQEVRGYTASTSTGSAGVLVAGISGAASGAAAGRTIAGT